LKEVQEFAGSFSDVILGFLIEMSMAGRDFYLHGKRSLTDVHQRAGRGSIVPSNAAEHMGVSRTEGTTKSGIGHLIQRTCFLQLANPDGWHIQKPRPNVPLAVSRTQRHSVRNRKRMRQAQPSPLQIAN